MSFESSTLETYTSSSIISSKKIATFEEIISLLKLSNKKFNQTVIIITHDLEIAKEADRVNKIEDGKILKDERN